MYFKIFTVCVNWCTIIPPSSRLMKWVQFFIVIFLVLKTTCVRSFPHLSVHIKCLIFIWKKQCYEYRVLNLKRNLLWVFIKIYLFFILSHQKHSTHYRHPVVCGGLCRDDVMHVQEWKLSGDRAMLDPVNKKNKSVLSIKKLLTVSQTTWHLKNIAQWLFIQFITLNVIRYKRR